MSAITTEYEVPTTLVTSWWTM